MIRITDQYFWNFIFLTFFSVLVVMGAIVLDSEAHIAYADITAFDLVLITLASFRAMRLFSDDTVTKFFREQFYDVKVSRGKVTLHKPESGPRRTVVDLLSCPWCFGVWTSAFIIFFYLLTPLAYFPVLILAISSVATFLQLISRLVVSKTE